MVSCPLYRCSLSAEWPATQSSMFCTSSNGAAGAHRPGQTRLGGGVRGSAGGEHAPTLEQAAHAKVEYVGEVRSVGVEEQIDATHR